MEDKYRLIKDTINCKAGTVFEFSFQGNWSHYTAAGTDGKTVDVDQSYVESHFEWFEPVKEDAFWNDELVGEFAYWYNHLPLPFVDPMSVFKAAKQKKDWSDADKAEFPQAYAVQKEKQEVPNEQSKGWEITSFKSKTSYFGFILNRNEDGTFGSYIVNENLLLNSPLHTIESVKRLRDNEVLFVGRKDIYYGSNRCEILSFSVMGNSYMLCNIRFAGGNELHNVNIYSIDVNKTS